MSFDKLAGSYYFLSRSAVDFSIDFNNQSRATTLAMSKSSSHKKYQDCVVTLKFSNSFRVDISVDRRTGGSYSKISYATKATGNVIMNRFIRQ